MDEETFNPIELIGKKLGQHRLEEIIGQTNKNIVYRGRHLVLDRQDAIKVLRPEQPKERREQFLREGKKLVKLAYLREHPNIANVYDAGEEQGFHYMVMKLVRGENLQDLIDAGKKFSLNETKKILLDISTADAYAHSKDIRHEDIKPANIKMMGEGSETIYLVDFGGRLTERGHGPPRNDVVAIGLIARKLLDNKESEDIIPRQLDLIVHNAEKGYYEHPDELKKALENYEKEIENCRKNISRRKFLRKAGIATGVSALVLGLAYGGIKHYQYKKSIDSVVDELEETDEDNQEKTEHLLRKLRFRLFDQKIRRLPQKQNFRKTKNGLEKLLFPYDISTGGTEWSNTNGTRWSDGFWPGILWLGYKITGDEKFKDWALEWANAMRFAKNDYERVSSIRFFYSHALGYDLTGDSEMRGLALKAAGLVVRRFNPNGNYLQLIPGELRKDSQVIDISAISDMPLLLWAYIQTGNREFQDKVILQTDATIRYNINEDGSVTQKVLFNHLKEGSAEAIDGEGFSKNSCHSRSQARAIKGLVNSYRTIENSEYIKKAEKCADFFCKHLPEDKVPFYDFEDEDFKRDSNLWIPKDSSAAAIGASGLLDLFEVTDNPSYKSTAIQILKSLSVSYLSIDSEYQGLLKHACADKNDGDNTDGSLIYGDYNFVEALSKI